MVQASSRGGQSFGWLTARLESGSVHVFYNVLTVLVYSPIETIREVYFLRKSIWTDFIEEFKFFYSILFQQKTSQGLYIYHFERMDH